MLSYTAIATALTLLLNYSGTASNREWIMRLMEPRTGPTKMLHTTRATCQRLGVSSGSGWIWSHQELIVMLWGMQGIFATAEASPTPHTAIAPSTLPQSPVSGYEWIGGWAL